MSRTDKAAQAKPEKYDQIGIADLVVVDLVSLKEVLQKPYTMIGTDSVATSPDLAHEKYNVLQAHPRNYGCIPHVLGNLVRQEGWLAWGDAIRKMTSLPAQRLGFTRRGLIREGMWADAGIVLPAKGPP